MKIKPEKWVNIERPKKKRDDTLDFEVKDANPNEVAMNWAIKLKLDR